jgi:Ca2+-binding EF-hand superfamily protein
MENKTEERYQDINLLNIKENKLTRKDKRRIQYGISQENISLNILYQDFIKLLLEFQIKLREKYLHKFAEKFKMVDNDKDGVINENVFKEMMIGFGIEFEDYNNIIEKMLDMLNPFEGNKIFFSTYVKIISDETATNGNIKRQF